MGKFLCRRGKSGTRRKLTTGLTDNAGESEASGQDAMSVERLVKAKLLYKKFNSCARPPKKVGHVTHQLFSDSAKMAFFDPCRLCQAPGTPHIPLS